MDKGYEKAEINLPVPIQQSMGKMQQKLAKQVNYSETDGDMTELLTDIRKVSLQMEINAYIYMIKLTRQRRDTINIVRVMMRVMSNI